MEVVRDCMRMWERRLSGSWCEVRWLMTVCYNILAKNLDDRQLHDQPILTLKCFATCLDTRS